MWSPNYAISHHFLDFGLSIFFFKKIFFAFSERSRRAEFKCGHEMTLSLTIFEIFAFEVFFSKIFFSLFRKDLDELSSNRVTTMAQFLTIVEILAFEYFFSKNFFSLFLKL